MKIKYNIVGRKIIKRPVRAKIVRERRRLKAYRRMYDEGKMPLIDVRNSYKSWRNGLLKECPQSRRSVHQLDVLYNNLFPRVETKKESREQLIQEIFKEESAYELNRLIESKWRDRRVR